MAARADLGAMSAAFQGWLLAAQEGAHRAQLVASTRASAARRRAGGCLDAWGAWAQHQRWRRHVVRCSLTRSLTRLRASAFDGWKGETISGSRV